MTNIFKTNKEERWPALIGLIIILALNVLMLCYNPEQFMRGARGGIWTIFMNHFQISGFDPFTYMTVSKWEVYFTEYRHPLLPFFWYPFYELNHWLMGMTRQNYAIFIVAAVMVILSFYSFIFLRRTFREIIGVKSTDATLLAFFFMSFSHIMLAMMVPDHFGVSLFMLAMTLYIAGTHIKNGTHMKIWQVIILFLLTSGVTLSNGVKTYLSALFTNGKRVFTMKFIIFAGIIPTLLIGGMAIAQNEYFIKPYRARGLAIQKAREAKDSTFKVNLEKSLERRAKLHGKAVGKKGVLYWTDISLSRPRSIVENLFGESIQLHQEQTLHDLGAHRPIFVEYSSVWNYIVEGIIILLFLIGIWCGRRSKFFWMAMSWFAFDMFIHLVLGFGLNEVYIMAAHWAFIIPIAICYLARALNGKKLLTLRVVMASLTIGLLIYNGCLMAEYFLKL